MCMIVIWIWNLHILDTAVFLGIHINIVCRISKQNRVLGGIWYGKAKPDMTLFLKPLAEALSRLYTEGMHIRN